MTDYIEETADEDKIRFDTNGTERVIIDANGNVGIGTTSPTSKLEINGNSAKIALNNGTNATSEIGIDFFNGDVTGSIKKSAIISEGINSWKRANMHFVVNTLGNANEYTLGTDTKLFISGTNGNVGIGTTSPSAKLDVNSDAIINGITVGKGSGNKPSSTTFGNGAYADNTAGDNNTAIGSSAMANTTTGWNNTAVGRFALSANTTGTSNAAFGIWALGRVVGGGNNTAAGAFALDDVTSGTDNTALGQKAGDGITTGSRNIVIGSNATVASLTGNDQLNIGNTIYGALANNRVGIETSAPTQTLDVNGQIRIRGGSPASGKVLTSGADGTATWQTPATTTVSGAPTRFHVASMVLNQEYLAANLSTAKMVTINTNPQNTGFPTGFGTVIVYYVSSGVARFQKHGSTTLNSLSTNYLIATGYGFRIKMNGNNLYIKNDDNRYTAAITVIY